MASSMCFIGSGPSVPFGIPTMGKMTTELEDFLHANFPLQLTLLNSIKSRVIDYPEFDIEALITILEDIVRADPASVLNHPSIHYFSSWYDPFPGMVQAQKEDAVRNRDPASELLKQVKGFIAESCRIKSQEFERYEEFFQRILSRHGYNLRVDIAQPSPSGINYQVFTTNYDPVLEAFFESRRLPWECGQRPNQILDIGSGNPRLIHSDTSLFQIYKLHGSTNWFRDQAGQLRWLTEPAQSGRTTLYGVEVIQELLIYPVREKYTFREPFYTMFHHLKECLDRSEMCFVVGYSFRDDDILGIFHDSMTLNARLNLCLIDPNARSIASDKFSSFQNRVQIIENEFSIPAFNQLGN